MGRKYPYLINYDTRGNMLSQKLYEYTTGTLSYDAEMIFYNGVELENW